MADETAFNAAVNQAEMTRQVAMDAATAAASDHATVANIDIAYFNAVIAAGQAYDVATPAAVDALAVLQAQPTFVTDDSGQFFLTTDNGQHLVFITEG